MCLEALERNVAPGCTVADIGCGSGLLSQAAILLGARCAIGCDLDPRAARLAAGIAFQGSVDSLRSQSIDLLVANIQVGVLAALLPGIRRVLKPGGIAILSGMLADGQAATLPVVPVRTETRGGWACLIVDSIGILETRVISHADSG